MTEDPVKALRDRLFLVLEGHAVDESIHALASALTTLIIGVTGDRDQARAALDRIVGAMRDHIETAARPPGTTKQ